MSMRTLLLSKPAWFDHLPLTSCAMLPERSSTSTTLVICDTPVALRFCVMLVPVGASSTIFTVSAALLLCAPSVKV